MLHMADNGDTLLLFTFSEEGILYGRDKTNLEPRPKTDSTDISPPIAFARFLLMVSPRPTPSWLSSLFRIILVKAVKSPSIFLGSIPTPVSMIASLSEDSSDEESILTKPF